MLNCPGAGVTTNSTNPAGLANGTTTCPDGTVNPVIAIIGSAPSTPQAGYPEMVVPMGYTTTQRRNSASTSSPARTPSATSSASAT